MFPVNPAYYEPPRRLGAETRLSSEEIGPALPLESLQQESCWDSRFGTGKDACHEHDVMKTPFESTKPETIAVFACVIVEQIVIDQTDDW
jgi:hypothetical protein